MNTEAKNAGTASEISPQSISFSEHVTHLQIVEAPLALQAVAALADGGKLIFPKLAHGGVTVAFSKVTIELSFKER